MNLRNLFLGTTVLAGALAVGAPSMAQAPAKPTTTAAAATAPEGSEVEAVVITGSRIKTTAYNAASPIQTITSETTDLHGIPDAATALLTSTAAAGSFQLNDQLTGFVTNGGGGTQSVALRGIGTQRTLTLLNGKRAGPSGTRGQVQAFDLNIFPASGIDRFEVLKDGASSIYGSDAIAGVVNIITKRNLNGGEINAYASVPTDTGGAQYRADGTWGQRTDNYYYNIGAEYYRAAPLRRKERAETSCAQDYLFRPDNGQRIDYINPATGDYKCYNQNTGYVQIVSTAANLMRVVAGQTYPTQAQGNSNNTGTSTATAVPAGWVRWGRAGFPGTYPYAPYDNKYWSDSTVISPVVRGSLTFNGGYNLTERAEIYTELLYNRRESHQVGSAQIFPSFAQRNIVNGAPNVLPASNPNNELGVDVVSVGVYESASNQDIDYYRAVAGLRGDFDMFGKGWNYDFYGQYSYSDATYDNGPRLYLDRFLATMSPGTACTNNPLGGNFSGFNCSALPQGVPWTSQRVLEGNFTQAEKDFLFINEEGTTTYTHAYVEGSLNTSSLFTLPAGDVGLAVGFQVRKEEIDDLPGFQARNRNTALFTTASQTKGSDNVRELFGELEIPILTGKMLAKDVDLNVSGRYSDYDSYGESKTYKVGLNWAMSDEYKIRASYGTSFRAPALYELYLGAQIGFGAQSANDPCINWASSGIEQKVQQSCAALGIPGDYTAVGSSSIPIASVGGKGVLAAETAKNYNIGFVWTPSFAPLSVAIDYYDITIKNAVDQFGGFNIVQECLRGDTAFCGLYTRDANTHFITSINNAYTNVSLQDNRGVDVQWRYRQEMPWSIGRLTVESSNNWKLEDHVTRISTTSDFLGDTYDFNGPQYSGNVYFTLDRDKWTYFYGVDMIGHGSDATEFGGAFGHVASNSRYGDVLAGRTSTNCALPATLNQCVYNKWTTDFQAYHSVSVRYRADGWTGQVGMNNIFDKGPPEINTGEFRVGRAMLNGYDMRGRRIFVRFGKTF